MAKGSLVEVAFKRLFLLLHDFAFKHPSNKKGKI